MAQATTNRVAIGVTRETSYAAAVSNGRVRAMRFTGASLAGAPVTKTSDEIISDRQTSDLQIVGKDVGGDLQVEFSFGGASSAIDALIEQALFNPWTVTPVRYNKGTADSIITDVSAANVYTYTTAGSDLEGNSGTFQIGHLVSCTNFTNSNNNGVKRVSATTATTITAGSASTAETAPPAEARLKCIGAQGVSADITATAGGTNSLGCTTLNFTTVGIVAGMWIKIGGSAAGDKFATAANNDWVRVLSVTSTTLVLDRVPSGWATDSGSGKTIMLFYGDYIRNGTTQLSSVIEERFLDITQFQYFQGMLVDSFTQKLDPASIMTGSFNLKGSAATAPAGSRDTAILTGTPVDVAAPTTDVFNTASNVARIAENGTPIGTPNYVLGLEITVNNNVRQLPGVSILGAVAANAGRCTVTGNIKTYFGDATLLAKVLANTQTSIDFVVKDTSGNGYLVDLPKVKFSSGTTPVPGNDQDITVDLNYQALKHATYGYTMHMQRFEVIQ